MTETKPYHTYLITGGCGFIGSAVIRHIIKDSSARVVNVDQLTYAGNPENLAEVENSPRYWFEQVDICDRNEMERIFFEYRPDAIMHLAAESHVDRSIDGPSDFIKTNISGTYTLLEVARQYWQALPGKDKGCFRFHHVSTDEVYGDLGSSEAFFTEETPYAPSSPYAASKASSDHLVRAWCRTYGLPAVLSNCSNNYGPYQFPEKLIPLMILNALDHRPLPVYGNGQQVRDWLYVEDHARALVMVMKQGAVGETYNIGGNSEKTNIDVVRTICSILDEVAPMEDGAYSSLITHVEDRAGHDLRYAIDASRIRRQLNWHPHESFESGIRKTVAWYLENRGWCERVQEGTYQRERLGVVK